uniref:Uncharacterized protein n=1 Tax=Pyxicephalus adspersus TaxID=30357 RepID=A0AAV3AQ17_PYXAD|nr:TPA: hypothetical protein GDO54_007061 [Pyxicephalus adspersus]
MPLRLNRAMLTIIMCNNSEQPDSTSSEDSMVVIGNYTLHVAPCLNTYSKPASLLLQSVRLLRIFLFIFLFYIPEHLERSLLCKEINSK